MVHRNSKPCDPTGNKGSSTTLRGGWGQRNGLGPTRGPVHDGEEMSKTSGTRKSSNQVHVNVTEPSSRNRNLNRGVNMLLNLLRWQCRHPLAQSETSSESPDQTKGTRNQPPGRTNTRVRDAVDSVENSAKERNGNKRTGQTGGEVTKDGQISKGYRDNPERIVAEKSRGFMAGLLQGGQLREIHRQGGG